MARSSEVEIKINILWLTNREALFAGSESAVLVRMVAILQSDDGNHHYALLHLLTEELAHCLETFQMDRVACLCLLVDKAMKQAERFYLSMSARADDVKSLAEMLGFARLGRCLSLNKQQRQRG